MVLPQSEENYMCRFNSHVLEILIILQTFLEPINFILFVYELSNIRLLHRYNKSSGIWDLKNRRLLKISQLDAPKIRKLSHDMDRSTKTIIRGDINEYTVIDKRSMNCGLMTLFDESLMNFARCQLFNYIARYSVERIWFPSRQCPVFKRLPILN